MTNGQTTDAAPPSWIHTMTQLATPALFAPVMLIGVGVLIGEGTFGAGQRQLTALASTSKVALDLALVVLFWVLGPWSILRLRRHPIAASVVTAVSAAALIGLFGSLIPSRFGIGPTLLADPFGFPITAALWVGGAWGLALLVTERQVLATAQRETAQAQVVAARRHLDPHFLFNTLNAIAEWCHEDPNVAEQAILQLSTMLRDVLEGIEQPTWSMDRELQLVQALVDLYRLRDPDRLSLSLTASVEARQAQVPSLVVLPVVENALKHGPWGGYPGTIEVNVSVTDDNGDECVLVEVINPGPFAKTANEQNAIGGRGLRIVHDRLALAFGRDARLTMETVRVADEDHTRALMHLPFVTMKASSQ